MLWDAWDQLMPPKMGPEDPRMLTPFLQRMILSQASEEEEKKEKEKEKEKEKDVKSQEESACRSIIRSRDKKIQELTSKLETTEKEVQTLKHQIDSLEAIHQKIQEKKKEVSSP